MEEGLVSDVRSALNTSNAVWSVSPLAHLTSKSADCCACKPRLNKMLNIDPDALV